LIHHNNPMHPVDAWTKSSFRWSLIYKNYKPVS
jgi:hypothetical protein